MRKFSLTCRTANRFFCIASLPWIANFPNSIVNLPCLIPNCRLRITHCLPKTSPKFSTQLSLSLSLQSCFECCPSLSLQIHCLSESEHSSDCCNNLHDFFFSLSLLLLLTLRCLYIKFLSRSFKNLFYPS